MHPRRIRQIIFILCFLVIPGLFLRARMKNPSDLNILDRMVLRISAPVQRGLSAIGWGLKGWFSRYFVLVGVKEENQRLQKENRMLTAQLHQLEEETKTLQREEALQALRSQVQGETISARVVAYDVLPFPNRIILICFQAGKAKVEPGMPVVAAEGVVGRVLSAYGNCAKTQLVIDPAFSLAVKLPHVRDVAVLKGMGPQHLLQIEHVKQKEDVQVGDAATTLSIGPTDLMPLFPPHLLVGTVDSVDKSSAELNQKIYVKPAVLFNELREVFVVLSKAPLQNFPTGNRR